MLRLNTIVLIILFQFIQVSYGSEYKGFTKLNTDECLRSDGAGVVIKLPEEWHKFVDFIKVCKLKQKDGTANASIISVWVQDYYDARFPTPKPHVWENIPLPLIVDYEGHYVGQLPQHFPDDPPRELDLYYREVKVGLPSEILVDVFNPAVSGNYYYAPITWNKKSGNYELKDVELKDGNRSE